MDKKLLAGGLALLAQCQERTGDVWYAHYGAGAIAGYFLSLRADLSESTAVRIASEAKTMLDARRFAEMAEPETTIDAFEAEALIVAALEATADRLHWVGHNFIYAAISLLALHELGGWGSKQAVTGIAALIRAFRGTIPGRSWIGYTTKEVKRLEPAAGEFPPIADSKQLSALVAGELAAFRTIYRAEAHHDLLGHMLTFSHALNALLDRGHRKLFAQGLPALLQLIAALRASRELDPDREPPLLHSPVDRLPLVPARRSATLPLEAAYWERDWSALDWEFGHAFKFPFSFYDHMDRLARPYPEALENFRYVIG
ncbi:hypothetical protein B5M42_023155 [Paenibacillus athensensis]|uniref:Uncharacterized protein n=1 Tax=Paenibacillus athensensis TaxID=1967502 RepID=A0A4Y8PUE4_9BACL|nr:hypothetical protein [Paenibacillus athensensis]MCD1261704.1 hypothetical protein [Paenibacillus athensensis]